MRLAISVLPTPVGPIMSTLCGLASFCMSAGNSSLLNLFLTATAMARLAASCPTMYSSRVRLIHAGVIVDSFEGSLRKAEDGLVVVVVDSLARNIVVI